MRSCPFLLLSVILFINCSPKNTKKGSLIDFAPINSALILKINDPKSLASEIHDNELINKFKKLPFTEPIQQKLKPLQYISNTSESLLTLSMANEDAIEFTFISNDSILELSLDSISDKSIETINYNDITLKKYSVDDMVFYSSMIRNREILSSSQILLQNIRDQESNPSLHLSNKKIFKLSDPTKLAHLWINVQKSNNLIDLLTDDMDSVAKPNYAEWLSLDLTIENNGLYFNGLGISNDSVPNYLGLFSKTKPLVHQTLAIAPDNTASYSSVSFNDFSQFSKNQNFYLQNTIVSDSLLSTAEEIGFITIGKEKLAMLKTYGTAQILDYINQIKSNTIDYQGSEIFTLTPNKFLSSALNPIVKNYNPKYATIIENTVLFSPNLDALQSVISNFKSGTTFKKSPLYLNSKDYLTVESTSLTLSNLNGFQTNLNEHGYSKLSDEIEDIRLNDYLFGSQIVADDGFYHTNYFIRKNSKTVSKTGVSSLFKVQLDTDILVNPQFVINHRTKKKEIVVQDQDNILYLISTKGKILWKKQLESAIQGKIHQVDIYKNDKLQLAFTTNNRFFILDRNGKEVEPFTFKYEGGNLNPLAVFDYEGKKNYRFVVTQNNKVYMYNPKGKIVSGFTYTKAEDNIVGAPQHFRIGQRDYLVFKLADNTLKILNRVGKERVKVNEKISFSENDIKVYKNQFTLSSDKGILYHIATNGTIQKTGLKLNADHGIDATSRTLAIINDNILSIRGKKVSLELGVYSKPTIFYLNDKIYVSVTDIQNQKSYLFDSQAKPIPDFPIFGTSTIDMADMDNDKKPELVIKDQANSLVVYKLH